MSGRPDSDPGLHIAVVAFTRGAGLEMTDEIALVKAALLYADRVTLASPKAIALATIATYPVVSPAERRDALMENLPRGAANSALRRPSSKPRSPGLRY